MTNMRDIETELVRLKNLYHDELWASHPTWHKSIHEKYEARIKKLAYQLEELRVIQTRSES